MWSGQVSLGAVRRGQVGYGMGHLAGGQLATVGLPVGAARWGTAWRGEERLGLAGYGEELATAAKRLAAVVYPMWSGAVARDTARYGVVRWGEVWCYEVGQATVWSGEVRYGEVWSGLVGFGSAW